MVTIFHKYKHFIIAIVIIVIAILISERMPLLFNFYKYLVKRIEYSDNANIGNLHLELPRGWWIESIDNKGIVVAKVPSLNEDNYILLSLFKAKENKLCEYVRDDNWVGPDCIDKKTGPLRYYRIKETGKNNLYDYLFVYPSSSVGVIGIGQQDNDINSIEYFIKNIQVQE